MQSREGELILASTSHSRRSLMDSLKVPYRCVAPGVEEDVPPGTSPKEAVLILAERKARAVASRFPHALIIGADQLVEIDGEALGKPPDRETARAQLQRLSGRAHQIVNGLCVMGPGSFFELHLDTARLSLYPLDAAELERYLDLEEWRGCAGGYRIESAGQALFSSLDGDRTGVQGLPMLLLVGLLRKAGVLFF